MRDDRRQTDLFFGSGKYRRGYFRHEQFRRTTVSPQTVLPHESFAASQFRREQLEIDCFDVSNDLEQKKNNFFFGTKKCFFGLGKFFENSFYFFANFFFWFYNECEPNPLPPAKLF